MDNSMNEYKNIYPKVLRELDVLLHALEKNDVVDEKINTSKCIASEKILSLHKQLEDNIISLDNNSEWDIFSIAFYGETNAGKSTLIETLRILLDENTKLFERSQFDQANAMFTQYNLEYEKNLTKINELNNDIEFVRDKYDKLKQKFLIEVDELETTLISLEIEIIVLNDRVINRITNSVKDFIKDAFGKLEEEKDIEILKNKKQDVISRLASLHSSNGNIATEKNEKLLDYNNRLKKLSDDNEKLTIDIDSQKKVMQSYSDGKIINAETDFTKAVVNYFFEYNGIKFSMMDLPGIEGNEKIVQDEINQAIEKAHVVFYVSKKARTPQNGDNDGGTIGKIKRQLSNQTEVYFIFNKGINNSRQLKTEIEGQGEKASLLEVDETMHSLLKDNYHGHISLSAFPAFASICNTTDKGLYNSKGKFLSVMNQHEILEITKMNYFVDWIRDNLVIEVKNKIITSNLNKMKSSITLSINEIESVILDFEELHSSVNTNLVYTKKELIENNNILNKNMNNILNKHINKFKNNIRKEAYKIIDEDVGNERLSKEFDKIIKTNVKEFTEKFNQDLDIIINSYQSDLENLVKKYDKYFKELIGLHSQNMDINYKYLTKIETKSKTDIFTIIGSIGSIIAGLALTIFGGETSLFWLVLGVVGGLISLGKEIIGLFDTDYKKSQQRKSVDENISKIEKRLEEESNKLINELSIKLKNSSNLLIIELNKNNEIISSIIDIFKSSKNKLKSLFKIIKVQEVFRDEDN